MRTESEPGGQLEDSGIRRRQALVSLSTRGSAIQSAGPNRLRPQAGA